MIDTEIKPFFTGYLTRLHKIVEQLPDACFGQTLAAGMFDLDTHVRIAANFALRGYCPWVAQPVVSFDNQTAGKTGALLQVEHTLQALETMPSSCGISLDITLSDQAGQSEVSLPAAAFMAQYIMPNFIFHISMVYAIARNAGVELGKADFDGLHQYPSGFSFVSN